MLSAADVTAVGAFIAGKYADRCVLEADTKGIDVAWINIDGAVCNPWRTEPGDPPDSMLDPDAIAQSYRHLIEQDRSVRTNELAVRPWVERF